MKIEQPTNNEPIIVNMDGSPANLRFVEREFSSDEVIAINEKFQKLMGEGKTHYTALLECGLIHPTH